MSALIVASDPDRELLMVVTDSIATDTNCNFLNHSQKSIHIPHLKSVICSVGITNLCFRWGERITQEGFAVDGVEDMQYFSQRTLKGIYNDLCMEKNISRSIPCTVVSAGFSEHDGLVYAFKCSSYDEFEPKVIINSDLHQSFFNPGISSCSGNLSLENDKDIVDVVKKQISVAPKGTIGGDIIVQILMNGGHTLESRIIATL